MGKLVGEAIKPGDAERMGCSQDGGETDSPAIDAQERYLQLRTDFDNLRRRAASERETGQLEGRRAALAPLLPVLDALEHALRAGSTDPAFYEGVAATHRLFIQGLRDAGADPIESVGRPFDPNVHEAVAMIPANAGQPGMVAREIRRGWRLGDMLLRPAQVVVIAPREADPVAVKFRDYYEVIGVPRTATAEEIKRAYRKLARKHHPDLKPAAERAAAAERFKEINEANEVLSDPDKRVKYDALGQDWKSGMDFTPPPGSGQAAPGSADWENVGDVSDFFASLFGRGAGRRGRGGVRVTLPGSDVEAELTVTLDELLRGGKRRLQLPGGHTIEVEIPPGVRDSSVLRLAGQGEAGVNGGPPGDLFLHVRLAPHPRYRVAGDDLELDLELAPWQAVLGDEVKVETLDGPVTLKVPPGTPSGRRLRLRGRGLPRANGERGDLHAIVRVVVPERPTDADRQAYEALKRATAAAGNRPASD